MYSNKPASTFENTFTVTPIKLEPDISEQSNSYPTSSHSSGSVAAAATTNTRRPSGSQSTTHVMNSITITNTAATLTTSNAPTLSTGAISKDKEKPAKKVRQQVARKPPPTLDTFWPEILKDVRSIEQVDAKHQALPLARIKKIMKLDDNAKMIAAEAPLLFARACEYFIQELTMRAWIHTEESRRRTLQRSDIAAAIANYDQFDFLIDIVPREEIKPPVNVKKEPHSPQRNVAQTSATSSSMVKEQSNEAVSAVETMPATAQPQQQQAQQSQPQAAQQVQIVQQAQAQPQQMQYFITIPGQQPGQAQLVQPIQLQQQQLPNGLAPQLAGVNLVAQQPQQLILTAGPNGQLTATPAPTQQQQQTALLQNLAQQQQQQQQIQLLQQVVTPTGEITNVPITINANQLNLLRLQMQQQQQQSQQQQVIIPAQCLSAPQLLQLGTTAQLQQQQQQQHQQQQQQQQSQNNNVPTFRTNC